MELASKYNPADVEGKWYQYWLDHKLFSSKPDGREPYTIVIPPPNVTGVLHMGHMLNNTIQDILVRRARMEGKNACWVPGTDHASIATEAKVVNKLAAQGIKKTDLTRDEFLKHAWEWTDEHGGIILKQLRKLGASCDWDRTAFTMDEKRSESVLKVFVDLYNKGLNCLDSWLFDDMKPFIHLECLGTFAKLRKAVDTDYFEKLIQEYLLDNTHGSSVTVKPKRGLGNEREEALAKELSDYKASLSDEEIKKLIEDTEHLKKYQEEPSSDEDLRKLPMLTRADMKKNAMPFSNIEDELLDVKVVRHDIESNGIDYISFLFDAGDFAQSELGYLGFFTNALGLVSTEKYSYTDLANATNIYTGGISTGTASHPDIKDRNNFVFKFEVKLKVLEKNLDKALELMEQMLLTSDFTDTKRLGELVAQIKARLQANLSSSGHLVAAMRSMSSFSRYALYQDELKGIAFYRSICRIEKELSESPKSVSDKLAAIAKKLFARNRMLISFTGNNEAYGNAKPSLEKVIAGFNKMSAVGNQAEVHFNTAKEAFIDASQIQYVAKTGDFICEGYEYTGALRLLRIILSYDYLWINVRVKGGAYGCMNTFLRSGESYFVSYRDPNLSDTLDVYDRIPEYIKNFSPDERDMTKYIIGTFSALDTPMNPEAKGSRSLSAYLEGITYEQIQKERNEILNAQPEDIRRLADLVEAVLKKDSICVIGNENMIKESAGLFENVEKLI